MRSSRPNVIARVAVEKGSILGWTRYTGLRGQIIGMRTFGASAPLKELQRRYGFMPENIVDRGEGAGGKGAGFPVARTR